jgi:hypothetical protein
MSSRLTNTVKVTVINRRFLKDEWIEWKRAQWLGPCRLLPGLGEPHDKKEPNPTTSTTRAFLRGRVPFSTGLLLRVYLVLTNLDL